MSVFEIRDRWTDEVIFSAELAANLDSDSYSVRLGAAVEIAVANGARLDGARLDRASLDGSRLDGASLDGASLDRASLDGASLDRASLDGASLDGASLVWARLDGARLDGARLDGASLVGARLDGARLDGARLDGASLDGASLDRASLVGASLVGASLVGARLDRASLDPIRNDLWDVLLRAQAEVRRLLAAVRNGRIDGSAYEGNCACLVGTIANIRGCPYRTLAGLAPNSDRPAERFFLALRPGHTPENNPVAAIVAKWIEEFLALTHAEAGPALVSHSS